MGAVCSFGTDSINNHEANISHMSGSGKKHDSSKIIVNKQNVLKNFKLE